MLLYVDDHNHYPPGRIAGFTQWDLCIGPYAGGTNDIFSPEARTALFMCPSVRVPNDGIQLNYSANPNVCKEVTGKVGPVSSSGVRRPSEIIIIGDAIQYTATGNAHAILWGAEGSRGSAIYWNDGAQEDADAPIRLGKDKDDLFATSDPSGSNFRYRHGSDQINALFADGHAARMGKGQVRDRHLYTNY